MHHKGHTYHKGHTPQAKTITASGEAVSHNPHVLIVFMICLAFANGFIEGMMNIALPHISEQFHIPLSWANWMIVGYTIVAATTITTSAAFLRRFGLRILFTTATAALFVGSLICCMYVNFAMLLIGRLIQAISTGLSFPTATSVILLVIKHKHQGIWLSVDSALIALGVALGPLVSGIMLTNFGIRSMFLVPACMALIIFVLGIKHVYIVEQHAHPPIDIPSLIMAFLGLTAFMFGIGEVFRDPGPSSIIIAVGFAILVLFCWRQLHIKTPLLDLSPLRHARYTVGIVLIMVAMTSETALAVLVPLYMEGAFGLTAAFAGLLIVGPVACDAVLAIFGGKIADKHGMWPIVPLGFVLLAGGIIGVWYCATIANLAGIIVSAGATFGGIGFIVAPDKRSAIGTLPHDDLSFGASIESVSVQVANSIGSALFVGVLSADVLQKTAEGMTKAHAYSFGFLHTVLIGAAVGVIGMIVAFVYAYRMHKERLARETTASSQR